MRCNHCTDAPCVEICPITALYQARRRDRRLRPRALHRLQGCMQACPYDALYIDPDSHTAAKCNFCAHRVERGLEPACVVVCPTEAICLGDIDDPTAGSAGCSSRTPVAGAQRRSRAPARTSYYVGRDAGGARPAGGAGRRHATSGAPDAVARSPARRRLCAVDPAHAGAHDADTAHPPPWGWKVVDATSGPSASPPAR